MRNGTTLKTKARAIHAADRSASALGRESGGVESPFHNETLSTCLINIQTQLSGIFFKDGKVSNC